MEYNRDMRYYKVIKLNNGDTCILRNGTEKDALAVRDSFYLTHGETDFLTGTPDESLINEETEARFLKARTESPDEIEMVAETGGKIVGCAGIDCIGRNEKLKHRANFGISVEKAYWGLGIGRALTEACIECAAEAGYLQIELEVVADNSRAVSLYESLGFKEFGRNPKGFRSRISGFQELISMRLEINEE